MSPRNTWRIDCSQPQSPLGTVIAFLKGIMGLIGTESREPDRVVDTRGSLCPDPLLRAQRALSEMGTGEVLELISDDPRARSTVGFWAMKAGHTSPGVSVTDAGTLRFLIRRRK